MFAVFAVMLRATWAMEVFSRTVPAEGDQPAERLTFKRGEAQLLTPRQFEAVRDDVGKALLIARTALGEDNKPVAVNKPMDPQPELPPRPARRERPASDADIRAENKRLKSELSKLSQQSGKLQEEVSLAKSATDAAKAKLAESELAEAELLDRVEKLEKELAAVKPADPPGGDK